MGMYESVSSREQKKKFILWACAISLVIIPSTALSLTTTKQAGAKPKALAFSHHSFSTVSRPAAAAATATTTTTTTTTKTSTTTKISSAITSACEVTLYPNACESALASIAGAPTKSAKELFDVSVQFAMGHAHSVRAMAYNLTLKHQKHGSGLPTGMDDCLELLDITLDQLNDVIDPKNSSSPHDIMTWLSAALTNQATCKDSLQTVEASDGRDVINLQVENLTQFISNSLALHTKLKGGKVTVGRKLLSDGLPAWLSAADRKLLEASPEDIRADAVVAKDGSGTHKTINEAIAFVSLATGGSGRSVIHVKSGTYNEYIKIPTKKKNVMLMGDGKGESVIVGSRNVNNGYTTYGSATVAAMGAGFIAKDLTIINDSGPSKEQGVALRVGGDKSVIYRCSIQGFQDTLYTHSNRQFYSQDDIYGTVDFIFGNSAVVFQNCYIQPRKPAGGQKNSITAQGRLDPNQNTGISIQKCRIIGASDLDGTSTYLGRPWHEYSRTVVMETYMDGSIDPAGWEPWSGSFALSTLYYGEYANTGPGSSTSGRVTWPGVHSSLSDSEASEFTVAEFIAGDSWLSGTGVSYNAGL